MKIPWFSIAFTVLVFYVAINFLDVDVLVTTLQSAKIEFIAFAFGSWVLLLGFKSLKWQKMVESVKGTIGFFESVRILFIGLFISVITPGRAGDFVRAIYVKDRVDLGKGILAVLVDRIIDVITLLVFAGIGIALLAQAGDVPFINMQSISLFLLLFGIAVALTLNRKVAKMLGLPLIKRFAPIRFQAIIEKYGRQFYDALPLIKSRWTKVAWGIVFSTAAWLLSITFGWLIMQSLGLQLSWTDALAVVPVLALVEIIPVGILGIGTREIAAVLVMGLFGVLPEVAVAYSLTYFALGYIPSFILGGYFFNRYPLPIEGGLKGLLKKGFAK